MSVKSRAKIRGRRALTVLVVATLVSAAPVVRAQQSGATGQPPAVGEQAPDFTLNRLDGKAIALSVLTQHRHEAPYGHEGGVPGARGQQRVVRASGEKVVLGPVDGCEAASGDRLVMETPGGGGSGSVSDS